jgi:hypothetical protein
VTSLTVAQRSGCAGQIVFVTMSYSETRGLATECQAVVIL